MGSDRSTSAVALAGVSLRRAVLLDIDGVLVVSWRALPGAADAVARLRAAGWRVSFVTNTSSLTRRAIADRLRLAGIGVELGEILTAGRAAVRYLGERHPGASVLLLNSGSIDEDLEGVHLVGDNADVVLTGGAGTEIDYRLLNRAFQLLLGGASLVAMHRNLSWVTTDGAQLDMGAFVAGLELAAGTEAVVVGKPAPEFYAAALAQVGAEPCDAVMVGDDVESDVLGAQAIGIRGVLVRTGKFRPAALQRARGKPDEMIDSIADLADLLSS